MAAVNESPVACDSALSAMMDDLEEGTLLSLLEDREFLSYLQTFPMTSSDGGEQEVEENDLDLSELFGDGVLLPDYFPSHRSNGNPPLADMGSNDSGVSLASDSRSGSTSQVSGKEPQSPIHSGGSESDISNLDSNDSDSAEDSPAITSGPTKRRKVDSIGRVHGRSHLTSCVEHDHCYTRVSSSERLHCSLAEKGAPNEEDTGYETMSSSTSPGGGTTLPSSSSSPTAHQTTSLLPPPSLPPLTTTPHINPVALIDARIKYFMRSQQVCLTEEEKETLKAEGLPIPTTLPLTRVEEKVLKSVRRKIRNKVAAQESRKRKKEHMEVLEDKVRQCTSENLRLQKKVETLESENRSLLTQLKKFQALVSGSGNSRHTTKVGACLMVVVLCFAVLLGGWVPQNHSYWTSVSTDYATTSVRSRSLLSVEAVNNYHTFPHAVCDWFRYIFLSDRSAEHHHSQSTSHHREHTERAWPDIFLSSYTPLTGGHQHNNDTPAIAA